MTLTITKEFEFDSSHRLIDSKLNKKENQKVFGKCFNYPSHGHLYRLFVTVEGFHLFNGMTINFSNLKEIVNKKVIRIFDHNFINDLECMKGKISTCENMVLVIWNLLEWDLAKENVVLREIKLYETPTSCATLTK